MYRKYLKRFFDVVFSALGLIVLSPLLLITYVLVVIFLGFPGIFKQERPGKDEKIFNLYKYRTMTNAKDENGELLPDKKRLTRFGKFLRSTSIDELPELFNIFKGDMSFVGPRPLLVKYLPYYTEKEHHRHDVRPGLTGLAQVNGRNLSNWDKKLKLDLKYVNNVTLQQDIVIIFKTVKTVIKSEGVSLQAIADLDDERRKNEQ